MRLPRPFIRLQVHFDVERLRDDISQLPESAWAPHPNHIAGNSSLRLISVDGGENDDVDGAMRSTPHLAVLPYLRQVLASFGVVWSRSRLLRLAPGAVVPEHADINYHWFNRVRVHIPIVTRPEVTFHCGGDAVHMEAGDAWIFDNWRQHRVVNASPDARIHLVADTAGSSSFWQFVSQSGLTGVDRQLPYDAARNAEPLTERSTLRPVMLPAELDLLTLDLRTELVSSSESALDSERLTRYHMLLDGLCRDWRQLYALYGEDDIEGRPQFERLRDGIRATSRELAEGLMMRTNRVAAHSVLEGRVLRTLLPRANPQVSERVQRPVFIIAAPRSGSTLLFETLAASRAISTLGGEGHWLIEGQSELRPDAQGVDSNRLERNHATPDAVRRLHAEISKHRRNSDGAASADVANLRFVEKTPKNALRVPFLDAAFPDAQFIFLWREPRENLASIIEAWKAGRWVTYRGLDGRSDPWSLLLPPGWRAMRDRPLAEIAAFQWESANRIALDDLEQLDRNRWTSVEYADLVANPRAVIERLAAFIGIEVDASLETRLAAALPVSRHTNTPPSADKWLVHREEILRVLPALQATFGRLQAL